jgi:hypothetical protein
VALRLKHCKTFAFPRLVAAALLLVPTSSVQGQAPRSAEAAINPFENMAGTWSGTGIITLGSGDKERIRCRVTYEVSGSGSQVEQDLRCASDSYKFDLLAKLTSTGGNISGYWSEKNRNLNGQVVGRASVGQIEAMAETSGFAAQLTLVTRGDRQSVRIESKGREISEVNITLRRASK